MNLSPRKQLFVDTASEMFGNGAILSKPQIREAATEAKGEKPAGGEKADDKTKAKDGDKKEEAKAPAQKK